MIRRASTLVASVQIDKADMIIGLLAPLVLAGYFIAVQLVATAAIALLWDDTIDWSGASY